GGQRIGGAAERAPGGKDHRRRGREVAQHAGDEAGFIVHFRISTRGMEVIEPSRSRSRVMSSMSVSKRTGTSNSKPAETVTPAAGAVPKVTSPVVLSTDQPEG